MFWHDSRLCNANDITSIDIRAYLRLRSKTYYQLDWDNLVKFESNDKALNTENWKCIVLWSHRNDKDSHDNQVSINTKSNRKSQDYVYGKGEHNFTWQK